MSLAIRHDEIPAAAADAADDDALYAPFWPAPPTKEDPLDPPDPAEHIERSILSGILAMCVSNHPTEENVAAVLAWNPEAAPLLVEWKRIWERSFPEGLPEAVTKNENEGPGGGLAAWYAKDAADLPAALEQKKMIRVANICWWKAARPEVEAYRAGVGHRDWRRHVVDDAETMASLRHAAPGDSWIFLGEEAFVLDRVDPDGTPIVRHVPRPDASRTHERNFRTRIRPDDELPYWTADAFLAEAGRGFAVAHTFYAAAMTLAAMARKGARKAFVKGIGSKEGTWTVDLASVSTPTEALVAFNRALLPWTMPTRGVTIQEHLPFLKEQRFFVVDGKVVASVPSDRRHDATHRGADRILDERVAVLAVPEIDDGPYDRGDTTSVVDRPLAARFARLVRRLAKGLLAEGYRDYVVDVGLTERGVHAVELNSLYLSGPYSLDRTRIVRARRRLASPGRAETFREIRKHPGAIEAAAAAGLAMDDVMSEIESMTSSDIAPSFARSPRGGTKASRSETFHAHRFRRLVAEVARRIGTRTPFAGEARIGPVGGMLETIGFGSMQGCEPLFSAPLEGLLVDEPAVGMRLGDETVGGAFGHGRLCGAVLADPAGSVLALSVAHVSKGAVKIRPVVGRFVAGEEKDGVVEHLLAADAKEREVLLVGSGSADARCWRIVLRVDGRTADGRDLPDLATDADGIPFVADWKPGAEGLPVPVGAVELVREPTLDEMLEAALGTEEGWAR